MDDWLPVASSEELRISRNQFWRAVWIWNAKPHVVNRRLFGVKVLQTFRSSSCFESEEIVRKLSGICNDSASSDVEADVTTGLCSRVPIEACCEDEAKHISHKCYFIVRRLLFKNRNYFDPLEICCINYTTNEILYYIIAEKFKQMHPSVCSFVMKFSNKKITVNIIPFLHLTTSSDWIKFVLLPKLIKWAAETDSEDKFQSSTNGSLKLISADKYNELYLHWKEKYGKLLVEKWTESTDPLKFVYEDIAIAAYLSLIWTDKKVSFVDLGCGNGLLVYILTQEGHRGLGIDIRARKIWSLYPPTTTLQVGTVTPNNNCYFPEADWILGNHSDELTPWIPVFAARSSFTCKFFLLPCCAYEFNGQRFQRRNSSVSVYNDYIDYITSLCVNLGFRVSVDRLRIPSTKRICLIGDGRTYDRLETGYGKVNVVLKGQENHELFTPRDSVEKVRNCTKVDRTVTSKISDAISRALIERQLAASHSGNDIWSANYSLSFEDAVTLLDPADLKMLKSECGGLQTLLKNNHSVFLIRKGCIFFRKPQEKNAKSEKWKKRPCWFFHNHPLRCPLPDNKCSFSHY